MLLGLPLNKTKKFITLKLNKKHNMQLEITNFIHKSQSVISNFPNNPKGYNKNYKGGMAKMLTKCDKHHIVYLITVERLSSNKIKAAMNLRLST